MSRDPSSPKNEMARDPLRTKLCDRLGIEHPIVAFTISREVAEAVTEAGAFAVLAGAPLEPDVLARDIKWLRERVGDKPFGVDLLLPISAPPLGTAEDLVAQLPEEHKQFVQGIKERHNVPDAKNYPEHYNLGWISAERARKQIDVVLEERIPVVAFGLGSPEPLLGAAHSRGMQVWGLVGKPKQAERELALGVDAIIAQGTDAAGHTGNIGTFSIVPAVAAIAGDTPVIAAGGVTTGRHLAAALCLGAVGVWTGTLWLASEESTEDDIIKQKIVRAGPDDTIHSRCVSGFTMRILKNQYSEEWESPEAPAPLDAPYQILLGAELQQAVRDYRIEPFMFQAAGQGVGFVEAVKPVREIIASLVTEARAVLDGVAVGNRTPAG